MCAGLVTTISPDPLTLCSLHPSQPASFMVQDLPKSTQNATHLCTTEPSALNGALPSPLLVSVPLACLCSSLQHYCQKYSGHLFTCIILDSARMRASCEQKSCFSLPAVCPGCGILQVLNKGSIGQRIGTGVGWAVMQGYGRVWTRVDRNYMTNQQHRVLIQFRRSYTKCMYVMVSRVGEEESGWVVTGKECGVGSPLGHRAKPNEAFDFSHIWPMDTETPETWHLMADSHVCAQLNQGRQSGNQTTGENIVAQIQSTVIESQLRKHTQ